MNIQEVLKLEDGSITDYNRITEIALFVIQNKDEEINWELTKKINPKFLYAGLYPIEFKAI